MAGLKNPTGDTPGAFFWLSLSGRFRNVPILSIISMETMTNAGTDESASLHRVNEERVYVRPSVWRKLYHILFSFIVDCARFNV